MGLLRKRLRTFALEAKESKPTFYSDSTKTQYLTVKYCTHTHTHAHTHTHTHTRTRTHTQTDTHLRLFSFLSFPHFAQFHSFHARISFSTFFSPSFKVCRKKGRWSFASAAIFFRLLYNKLNWTVVAAVAVVL